MFKKYVLILLVALALSLSACTRAASVAPLGTPSPDANFPQPVATSSMNAIEMAGTQTAIATAGLPMPTAAGADAGTQVATQAGGLPTFTPLAGINTPTGDTVVLPTVTTQAPAAANTPVPQSSAPISNPGTYSLHEGEFPYCLARRYNVNPDTLLAQNNMSSFQSYYAPGTRVVIPQNGGVFPGPRALKAHPVQYTVRAGDTIYSIACEFGDVDPQGIVSANGLSGAYNLTTGSTIQIP